MVSKAKAAKLVRALVDLFLDMEAGTGTEVSTFHVSCPQTTLTEHSHDIFDSDN